MQLTPAALLITGFKPAMAPAIVDAIRAYLGTATPGVSLRIAGRHGLGVAVVTDPAEGIGSLSWMIDNEALGRAVARAAHTGVYVVLHERRSDWESTKLFDAGGRSTGATARTLAEAAERLRRHGADPRLAIDTLPLGVLAGVWGMRRHHLEDLIDTCPGITVKLDSAPDGELAAAVERSLGEELPELSERPRTIELIMPAAIADEIGALRKKLRASEPDVVEAVWRIAIEAGLYDRLNGSEGESLRPYSRFARPKLERVTAAWQQLGALPESERRSVMLSIPERVVAELNELAAHVDVPASEAFVAAYVIARARDL